MDLVEAWSNWKEGDPPHILAGDEILLNDRRDEFVPHTHANWDTVIRDPNFGGKGDARLHLGLLPQPYMGDLRTAQVYILMLNPGYGFGDYFGESEVPEYRKAILSNLRQEFAPDCPYPFYCLNPRFEWHGAFRWWHQKLRTLIEAIAGRKQIDFAESRRFLAKHIACVEAFPYHSMEFRPPRGWRKARSVALARKFVHDTALARVRSGEAIIIVTRKVAYWKLDDEPGVYNYHKGARSASLAPGSPGGDAILGRLL